MERRRRPIAIVAFLALAISPGLCALSLAWPATRRRLHEQRVVHCRKWRDFPGFCARAIGCFSERLELPPDGLVTPTRISAAAVASPAVLLIGLPSHGGRGCSGSRGRGGVGH